MRFATFFTGAFSLVLAAGLSKTQVENIKNADDVVFAHDFPRNAFGNFVIDEKATVRINMTNNSPLHKTVFGITGFYTDPENAGKKAVKISSDKVQILVKSGKTIHLKYKFTPQANSGDVGLLVEVDYYDSDEPHYKSVGALQVVKLVYGDSLFDLQSVSIYVCVFALVGGLVYSFVGPTASVSSGSTSASAPKKIRPAKAKPAAVAAATTEDDDANDWLPEHIKNLEKKASQRRGKK